MLNLLHNILGIFKRINPLKPIRMVCAKKTRKMKRNEVKEAHEKSVLESFKRFSASLGNTIAVVSNPEPPDAIVTVNGTTTWIEITDAFLSSELAESVTSHVADDKLHKQVPKDKRKIIDPDYQFSSVLESVILNKYNKISIGNVYQQYGSGILLVGIINPFSDARTLSVNERPRILNAIKTKETRFKEIYLYEVNIDIFYKLL